MKCERIGHLRAACCGLMGEFGCGLPRKIRCGISEVALRGGPADIRAVRIPIGRRQRPIA
jgi:hypothetical protein